LTDGAMAGDHYSDSGWVGYLNQGWREVVIDLGVTSTIHRLSTDFLFFPSAGIFLPDTLSYSLSEDGTTFRVVGLIHGNNTGIVSERRHLEADITPTYARFVKLIFDVNTFCFVDEVSVRGTSGVEVGAQPPSGDLAVAPVPDHDEFLHQGTARVGCVSNMFLAYTYQSDSTSGEIGRWSMEDLRAVVTHVDASGVSTDWMWDTVLFMAGVGNDYGQRRSWDDLLDQLFEPDNDVDALDQAVREARSELGAPRKRRRVILGIPNPDNTLEQAWGVLDGQLLDLNPTRVGEEQSAANRAMVVDWYITEAIRRFESAGHANIELAGFYWMIERIAPRSSDSALVHEVSRLIRARGLKFYWIPHYQAAGYQNWRRYGFDAAMLQHGYHRAPWTSEQTERLTHCCDMARWSGQGIQLSIDGQVNTKPDALVKWFQQLSIFHEEGAGEAIKCYYWGSRKTFQTMLASTNPEVRRTYDAGYEFIRESR